MSLRLVTIGSDGSPSEPCPALPAAARDASTHMAQRYARMGFVPPWVGYLAFDGETCVGTCAFKAPPAKGRVEIGYYTFARHEGRGIATRMARDLVAIARTALPGVTITAQTLPETSASTSVLRKLGFEACGAVMHPEDGLVWEWELPPA